MRPVAEHIGVAADLGVKGKCGIPQPLASCQAFICDPSHPIFFYSTPSNAHGSISQKI